MIPDHKFINTESSALQYFQQSTMTVTEKVLLNKKLKSANDDGDHGEKKKLICRLRITTKSHPTITGNDTSRETCLVSHSFSDSGRQQFSSNTNYKHPASLSKKRKVAMDSGKHLHTHNTDKVGTDSGKHLRTHNTDKVGMDGENHWNTNNPDAVQDLVLKKSERYCVIGAERYTSTGKLDQEHIHGLEILDANRTKQCAGILRKLMTHKFGWVFNQPVDPVKLNIPDYFSIIKKPMDLGTIKQKLECKRYSKASQFFDDVKLTFTNAMQYNPPSNDVHVMAKMLCNIFSTSWKVLEAKWSEEVNKSHDDTYKQSSSMRSKPPKRSVFLDPHVKHLPVPAERTKAAHEQQPGMQLHNDADSEWLSSVRHSSDDSTCNVVPQSILDNGDEDSVLKDNSGDENFQPAPTPATCESGIEQPSAEEQLSPDKALRAALLKSRFADTILKAQQTKLANYGEKVDPLKMKKEKERLEKMLQEERLKIEAEKKAAEAAIRNKETELKLRREKEREAARLALQQMEKTVDIDENYGLLRELQSFGYADLNERSPDNTVLNFVEGYLSPGSLGNPLEQLGLFMKDDLDEEVDDASAYVTTDAGIEEGEIGSGGVLQ